MFVLFLIFSAGFDSPRAIAQMSGGVVSWGANTQGQTNVPTRAQGGVTAIDSSFRHTVALKNDGTVVAWGLNSHGQTDIPPFAENDVKMAAAGGYHTVVLKNDGRVFTWGKNDYRQTNTPATAQTGIVAVAAGLNNTAAGKKDGGVVVWGNNTYQQNTVPVEARKGIVGVDAGRSHVLALNSGGTVLAWGRNNFGQTNVPPNLRSGVKMIAAGLDHSLALREDGIVVAWGKNDRGQTNVPPDAHGEVLALAAGDSHSAVLKSNGSVVAWGSRVFGATNVPTAIQGSLLGLASGDIHLAAIFAPRAPIITKQPESLTGFVGTPVTFSVLFAEARGVDVQWYRNGNIIPGATNLSLTFLPTISDHNSVFRLVAEKSGLVTTSENALLKVVAFTSPALNTRYFPGDNVILSAETPPDLQITGVAFFAGDQVLARLTHPPYNFVWSNPSAGRHSITLSLTLVDGSTIRSPVVPIVIWQEKEIVRLSANDTKKLIRAAVTVHHITLPSLATAEPARPEADDGLSPNQRKALRDVIIEYEKIGGFGSQFNTESLLRFANEAYRDRQADDARWKVIEAYYDAATKAPAIGNALKVFPALYKLWHENATYFGVETPENPFRIEYPRNTALANLGQANEEARMEASKQEQMDSFAKKYAFSSPEIRKLIGNLTPTDGSTAAELLSSLPAESGVVKLLKSSLRSTEELKVGLADLESAFPIEMSKLQAQNEANFRYMRGLAAQQTEIYKLMTNWTGQQAAEQQARSEAAKRDLEIQSSRSSVYILSTLVGFADPKLGKQMNVVGNSAITIATAVSSLKKGANFKLATILTGNILGAVMDIFGLFGGGPSPDEMILEEIADVKNMIQNMREEMHDRFDRVDLALNRIYSTMNDRFNDIDFKLGVMSGDIQQVQKSLVSLQADLSRLEQRVFTYLDTGFRRPLHQAINGGIRYEENFGVRLTYESFLNDFENIFHSWATLHAYDGLEAGYLRRDYTPGGLKAELTTVELENNINYLNYFLKGRFSGSGFDGFSQVTLPNPRDWAIAGGAYLDLCFENPDHFRRISVSRIDQIIRGGEDLERAFAAITATNSSGKTIFDFILAEYRKEGTNFVAALRTQESKFKLGRARSDTREIWSALNLMGNADQATTFTPPLQSLEDWDPETDVAGAPLALPDNWVRLIPNAALLGELLGISSNALGFERLRFINQRDYQGFIFADFHLILSARSRHPHRGGVVDDYTPASYDLFASPTNMAPWPRGYQLNGFLPATLRLVWEGFPGAPIALSPFYKKSVFTAESTSLETDLEATPLVEYLDLVRYDVEGELRRLRTLYYSALQTEVESALKPSLDRLSGLKKLLEGLVTFGMEDSLAENDLLRATLFGNESIIDGDSFPRLLSSLIDKPDDTDNRIDFQKKIEERISGIEAVLTQALATRAPGYHGPRLVRDVLQKLRVFRALRIAPPIEPYITPVRSNSDDANSTYVQVNGIPHVSYVLQGSSDLKTWFDVGGLPVKTETQVKLPAVGFYRAVAK